MSDENHHKKKNRKVQIKYTKDSKNNESDQIQKSRESEFIEDFERKWDREEEKNIKPPHRRGIFISKKKK